jgi:prenyltransferase/squalene oxidase-like repeat protein
VQKGLDYLARNQFKDGHWEGDDGKHPMAMTGLVGLALLLELDTKEQPCLEEPILVRKYSAEIRRAANWLMDKADGRREGLLFSGHSSETERYMQSHGLATLFLAGAYVDAADDAQRKKLAGILGQTVNYIVKAQSTQGGWYRTSKAEGHDFDEILATALQMQALQAAENVGIPIPAGALNDGKQYLMRALRMPEEKSDPARKRSRQTETAAASISVYNDDLSAFIDRSGKNAQREEWFKVCRTEIPVGPALAFGRDDLTHYWFAQVMFDRGGDAWSDYRTAMFDHLRSRQNKDGSWPTSDGIGVGPVYATALWCVVLQLDKKSHPSRHFVPAPVS